MNQTLQGKIAVVSGGAGDIGGAVAVELARRGADVSLGDIVDKDGAQPTIERVERTGRRCKYRQVDTSDGRAITAWIDEVEADWDVPEIAVAAAAVVTFKGIDAITFEEWDREFAVNVHGYFYLCRTVANRLVDKKRPGRIVLIGSAAGDGITMGLPTYCITKIAVRKLVECLAAQYARHGILVNDVAPGMVDAGLSAAAMRENPAIRPRALKIVPTREMASAEDIAEEVAHLCQPENRHITGSTVFVDGGMRLKIIEGFEEEE